MRGDRCEVLTLCPGHSVKSLTVWTEDHSRGKGEGEVSHSVCGKTEHPEDSQNSYNNDISILYLCKPLIFTKGWLHARKTSYFYTYGKV